MSFSRAQTLKLFAFLATLLALLAASIQQDENAEPLPVLNPSEQEAVYRALELINGDVPWRVIFPDDLCLSAPHGVVCDYFFDDNSTSSQPDSAHVTELNFGYVSDYNSNPPCAPNATLPFWIFSSLPHLRKLFVFNCFVGPNLVTFPDVPVGVGAELEELVLIDNPALNGSLTGIVRSFVNLRKLVITGSGFSGGIPDEVGGLVRLEQMTLSNNKLNGVVAKNLTNLTSLKLLDLSRNEFHGALPESIGEMKRLLKLDLSFNEFTGKIPDQIGGLSELEFLDLSYNRFERYGVPMFLADMVKLKEVYLSGNELGGEIPDVWEKLGGLVALGFSGVGLAGELPESMAVSLKSLSHLGLENNSLEGKVPEAFLEMENLREINLGNNKLSGMIRLRANVTAKRLKLGGNPGLCVDRSLTGYSYMHGLRACDDVPEKPFGVPRFRVRPRHSSTSACSSLGEEAKSFMLAGFLGLILSYCL